MIKRHRVWNILQMRTIHNDVGIFKKPVVKSQANNKRLT